MTDVNHILWSCSKVVSSWSCVCDVIGHAYAYHISLSSLDAVFGLSSVSMGSGMAAHLKTDFSFSSLLVRCRILLKING